MVLSFRRLNDHETEEFKGWARRFYTPGMGIQGVWHPVTQAECVKMNEEAATWVDE